MSAVTTETTPEQFASDFLTLLASVRPEGLDDVIAELERARAELAPVLERAETMISSLRQVSHELLMACREQDPRLAAEMEDFISVALRRSDLYDALYMLSDDANPEAMFQRDAEYAKRMEDLFPDD